MQLFIDNWSSSLAAPAGIADEQLTIPALDAARLVGLGGEDYYELTLVERDDDGLEVAWEVVTASDASGGVLVIQRGPHARNWSAGAFIGARITADAMRRLQSSGGPGLSDSNPEPLGEASPGTESSAARGDHVHPLPTAPEIGAATAAQGAKADSAIQSEDLAAVATSGDYDDLSNKPFIPSTPGDVGAATADQGDKADTAVQPDALSTSLASKVDKEVGFGLSQENYTAAEKAKLASLDEAHYKGTHVNLAALQAAHPTASAGNYADVDAGIGDPVLRYIWDASDGEWRAQAGSADPVTAAQVKALYESNPDTNAFSNAEKAKLGGVAPGATANSDTDSLAEGAANLYHSEVRVRGTFLTGLSLASTAVVVAGDNILQAIGKLAARLALAFDRANHSGEQAMNTVTGLQTALASKAPAATVRTITGTSGTLLPSDNGAIILCTSASAVTLTIQAEASGAWPEGAVVHIIQMGAGAVTIADGSGITVNVYSGLTKALRGQYAQAALVRSEANRFALAGTLGGTPA